MDAFLLGHGVLHFIGSWCITHFQSLEAMKYHD